MAPRGLIVGCAGLLLLALTSCEQQTDHCDVGAGASFALTVQYSSPVEPSVQLCTPGQCSPTPPAGPIPTLAVSTSQSRPARVEHVSPGHWVISPGTGHTPATMTVRLYDNGRYLSSTVLHLHWPHINPCSTNIPSAPSPTITAPGPHTPT